MTDSLFLPPDPAAYLRELVEVGRRHGFVLSHQGAAEDAFVARPRPDAAATRDEYDTWLLQADTSDCPKPGPMPMLTVDAIRKEERLAIARELREAAEERAPGGRGIPNDCDVADALNGWANALDPEGVTTT